MEKEKLLGSPGGALVKTCNTCKVDKPLEGFAKNKGRKDGLHHRCRLCVKQYREENKESRAAYDKQYSLSHRQQDAKQKRAYRNKRTREDDLYRLRERIRGLIGTSIRRRGYSKDTYTRIILDTPVEVFMAHIESRFTEGMTWDNMGKSGWEFDHIIPSASAKNDEEALILNHYRNLRPLWAKHNRAKRNTMPTMEEIKHYGIEDIYEALQCGY